MIEFKNVVKEYADVTALGGVSFTVNDGEFVFIVGDSGSGKSTLIKCLTGVNKFEAGEIHVDGIEGPIVNKDTMDAQKKGISTVYQEVNLCPNLSVAENLFIGREPVTKIGTVNRRKMNTMAAELMKELELDIDVTQNLENYSLALQQMVAIARAVDMKSKVLILDEPTSSLDDNEVEKLFGMMRKLRDQGVGIIFVTHFLEQVYAVCDGITVLRNGTLVGEYTVEELPRVKLVAAMMGKDFDDLSSIKPEGVKDFKDVPLEIEAKGLSHAGKIKPFDLDIHKGEVVGLTGLLGSGRSELARAIYGADRAQTGTLKVDGKEVKIKAPIDAMNLGMGLLPDDRKAEGIIGDMSVRENIVLAMQAKLGMFKKIPVAKQNEIADKFIDLLQIKTASRETLIKQLSGGNQQKVILARWLATEPEFLILDEHTAALDPKTAAKVLEATERIVQKDKLTTLMITHNMKDAIVHGNRLIMMYDGRIVIDVSGEEKKKLTVPQLLELFSKVSGSDEADDKLLLS